MDLITITESMTDDEMLVALEKNQATLKLRQEFNKLSEKALKMAVKDCLFRTYKMAIENDEYDSLPSESRETVRRLCAPAMEARRKITDKRYGKATHFFVTVNVMSEKATEDYAVEFQSEVHQFLNSCTYTKDNYLYCIEQRSSEDTEDVHGLHAHILVPKKGPPSDISRAFFNRFLNKWCGNQKHCYIVSDDSHEKVYRHEQYIMGNKSDAKKMLKVEQDRKMRLRLGLNDYYHDPVYVFKTGVEEKNLTIE